MLGLAMVEGLDGLARQVCELAEDGLLPACLVAEWRCTHARSGAAIVAGITTATLALCLSMKTLVQVRHHHCHHGTLPQHEDANYLLVEANYLQLIVYTEFFFSCAANNYLLAEAVIELAE